MLIKEAIEVTIRIKLKIHLNLRKNKSSQLWRKSNLNPRSTLQRSLTLKSLLKSMQRKLKLNRLRKWKNLLNLLNKIKIKVRRERLSLRTDTSTITLKSMLKI
mgnify:CR=1 FL=1